MSGKVAEATALTVAQLCCPPPTEGLGSGGLFPPFARGISALCSLPPMVCSREKFAKKSKGGTLVKPLLFRVNKL